MPSILPSSIPSNDPNMASTDAMEPSTNSAATTQPRTFDKAPEAASPAGLSSSPKIVPATTDATATAFDSPSASSSAVSPLSSGPGDSGLSDLSLCAQTQAGTSVALNTTISSIDKNTSPTVSDLAGNANGDTAQLQPDGDSTAVTVTHLQDSEPSEVEHTSHASSTTALTTILAAITLPTIAVKTSSKSNSRVYKPSQTVINLK